MMMITIKIKYERLWMMPIVDINSDLKKIDLFMRFYSIRRKKAASDLDCILHSAYFKHCAKNTFSSALYRVRIRIRYVR